MRGLIILTIICFLLAGCTTVTVVNNCPAWLEVGTISIKDDTEETKRWMFRYEKSRIKECKSK